MLSLWSVGGGEDLELTPSHGGLATVRFGQAGLERAII